LKTAIEKNIAIKIIQENTLQ